MRGLSFFRGAQMIGKLIGFMVKAALLFVLIVLLLSYLVTRVPNARAPEAAAAAITSDPASAATGLPQAPPPVSPVEEPFPKFKPRQLAVLDDPSAAGGGVWLATTVADRGELLYAQQVLAENRGHAGAPIYQMSSHGRAK
jgi:hypothetical protein